MTPSLSSRLRTLRELRGLTQAQAARFSGIGEKTISSFETGDRIDSMKVTQLLTLLKTYSQAPSMFFRENVSDEAEAPFCDSTGQRGMTCTRVLGHPGRHEWMWLPPADAFTVP